MEIDEKALEAAITAAQRENRPKNGMFNSEQLDAMDEEARPAYRTLIRAALLAYESSRSQSSRDAVIEECAKLCAEEALLPCFVDGDLTAKMLATRLRALKRPADRKGAGYAYTRSEEYERKHGDHKQ